MKKTILTALVGLTLMGAAQSAQAYVLDAFGLNPFGGSPVDPNHKCGGNFSAKLSCRIFKITSFPTLFIMDEQVDLNSAEGQALFLQEALGVLQGKKSLVITDSDGKTAQQKAQEIVDAFQAESNQ